MSSHSALLSGGAPSSPIGCPECAAVVGVALAQDKAVRLSTSFDADPRPECHLFARLPNRALAILETKVRLVCFNLQRSTIRQGPTESAPGHDPTNTKELTKAAATPHRRPSASPHIRRRTAEPPKPQRRPASPQHTQRSSCATRATVASRDSCCSALLLQEFS